MTTFNQAQFDDLAIKGEDLYASAKYDILERFLKGRSGLRILNAGCGSGELSLRLASLGHTVVGIDVERAYIELALRSARASQARNCTFQVCSIEQYESEGGFDCAVSTDVLEHIEDDRAALSRLVSLVRPGGLVLLTVPAGQWLFGYHDEQLGHYRRYTKRSLRKLVGEHCEIEAIRYFGFSLIPVCLVFSKWLRRPYPIAQAANRRRRPLTAFTLRTLMKLDKLLPLPVGTSLLLKAIRRSDAPPRKQAA